MRFLEDLQLARDKRAGKKATMHVYQDGDQFFVVNDICGGQKHPVFTGETVQSCWDWYLDRVIGGCVKVG